MDSLEDTQDYVCSITPQEFEVFCMDLLKNYAKEENLKDFTIEHNIQEEAYDGTYQIDVYASFTALGGKVKILCECKQYSSPVKRERVEILESRLKSLGMHKGILLSTSGFQKGAITYAQKHGIHLIQVFDHSCYHESYGAGPNNGYDERDPWGYMAKRWPKYRVLCYINDERTLVLYPTREMLLNIYKEANILLKEQYGFEIPLETD